MHIIEIITNKKPTKYIKNLQNTLVKNSFWVDYKSE